MENKKKYIFMIIIMMIAVILVGTYAWLTYRTNDTAMVLTIGDIRSVQVTLSPYQIKGTLDEVTTYTSGKLTEVEAVNNSTESKKFKLYYQINSIDASLATSSLKYKVMRSTNGSTYSDYQNGTFSGTYAGSNLTIMEETLPAGPNLTYMYKVYLWLNSGSSGASGTFDGELRADIVNLPSQYQHVEYIQFSGTQYIDTGVLTNQNLELECDFSTTTASKLFFGARGSTSANGLVFGYFSTTGSYVGFGGASTNYSTTMNLLNGNRHIVNLSNSIYKIDGVNQTINNRGTLSQYYNIYLGTWNTANVADDRRYVGKVYSFKISKNGVLVRNFVPCYDKNQPITGGYKAGFCDLVSNTFFGNSGTGEFTYGNAI